MTRTPTPRVRRTENALHGRFRWISVGMNVLILLSAFEAMAVTTVMPLISRELDGASLYAMAFAGPLAVGVLGMVVAGNWADRNGPKPALYASVALFVIGLLVAGTAENMWVLVAGRLIHGLGGGALIVPLYVIVARVYPATLQPRVFAGFAAAWVIPSLIGPLIAGIVAEQASWHWVFLGVVALVVPALAMVLPALRGVGGTGAGGAETSDRQGDEPPSETPRVRWSVPRILWASVVAASVLALNLASQLAGAWRWIVPVIALTVALTAVRRLLPPGTLRARRGLPSIVLVRGLVAAAYFGAEVYLPYLLTTQYALTASMAGLALTAGGVSWALASWVQGKYSGTFDNERSIRVGAGLVLVAILLSLATTVFHLPPAVAIAGWAVAGFGMGTMYPLLSTMTLGLSTPLNQGFNSSALAIADSTGASVALALTAIVFAVFVPFGAPWPFAGCFVLVAVIAVVAWLASHRVGARSTSASH